MLHKQGSVIRLPLPIRITSLAQKQEPTNLYKLQGTDWKLIYAHNI